MVVDTGKEVLRQLNLQKTDQADNLLEDRLVTSFGLLTQEVGIALGMFEESPKMTVEQFNKYVKNEVEFDDVDNTDNKATVPFIRVKVKDENLHAVDKFIKLLGNFKPFKPIADGLFDIDYKGQSVSLEPPTKVKKTIDRSINTIPDAVDKAIAKFQKEKWRPDPRISRFIDPEYISKQEFLETFLGWKDPEKVHVTQRDPQIAINRNLEKQYDDLLDHFAEHGDAPIYLSYEAKRNLRAMIDSNTINYQSSKLHRAFYINDNWETEVDINNEQLIDDFILAVGLWADISVDKQINNKAFIQSIKDKLDEPVFRDAWKLLQNESEWGTAELATLKKAIDEGGHGAETLSALQAWADYKLAEEQGKTSFTTNLADEVDGLTNGLAITLLQIPSSVDKVLNSLLPRVGIFSKLLASAGITSFAKAKKDINYQDNYQTLAK